MTTATDGPILERRRVAIIGGGPAGLMAAEALCGVAEVQVDLYDAMPSVGRKFLLAGKGGLNLTHNEAIDDFSARYGAARVAIEPMLRRFGPAAVREWARSLGVETFVGSSGRVFPNDLKAAPLLRAWTARLRTAGVAFHMRHRWRGCPAAGETGSIDRPIRLRFETPAGEATVEVDACILALGGASWPQLGSDGAWVGWVEAQGIAVAPLRPSNCGFDVERLARGDAPSSGWSPYFRERFAGAALKNVAMALVGEPDALASSTASGSEAQSTHRMQRGEFVVTAGGIEGSLVYALSASIRDRLDASGRAVVTIDLLPQHDAAIVRAEVARPRGSRSLGTHLKSRLGLDGAKAALLHELLPRETLLDPVALAASLKSLRLRLRAARPVAEAISTAGGVRFAGLDAAGMSTLHPGVFFAGEMLNWEAPTGGYLLTACMASGVAAGDGAARYLRSAVGARL